MDAALETVAFALCGYLGTGLEKSPLATIGALALTINLQQSIRSLVPSIALVLGTTLSLLPAGYDAVYGLLLPILSAFSAALLVAGFGLLLARTASASSIIPFPLAWAVGWAAFVYVSPFGRAVSWTPIMFSETEWFSSILGAEGVDFAVATAALVLAGLLRPTSMDQSRVSREIRLLGLAVLLLTVPSHLLTSLPRPVDAYDPVLRVACVQPRASPAGLADYIAESEILASRGAKLVLWPESALQLSTADDLTTIDTAVGAFSLLRRMYVAATFTAPASLLGIPDARGRRVNALALFDPDGNRAITYTKHALVPFTESFTYLAGSGPLPVLDLSVPIPPSQRPGAPGTPHPKTLNVTVAPAICLDASHPPYLIPAAAQGAQLLLNPASLWSSTAAWDRLATLRMRAAELGMGILTCDAGAGGVSAYIDGSGRVRAWQVGRGTGGIEAGVEVGDGTQSGTVYGSWLGMIGSLTVLAVGTGLFVMAPEPRAIREALGWQGQVGVLVELDGDGPEGRRSEPSREGLWSALVGGLGRVLQSARHASKTGGGRSEGEGQALLGESEGTDEHLTSV